MSAESSVIDFWFGAWDRDGLSPPSASKRWWQKSEAFDTEIRTRFLEVHERWRDQQNRAFDAPLEALAHVIVLDQFSRNMFRGTPDMFRFDARALSIAADTIAAGIDRLLATDPRVFLYMPYMHAEDADCQARCVDLFTAFLGELDASCPAYRRIEQNLAYAVQHRDIIDRFGRFPHRNALLGRASTADERAFLQTPGSSF